MNYLPFALAAYFFNGVAVLIDKSLLSGKIKHPLVYIFYISLFSLVILLLLPLTHRPSLFVFALASTSTIIWTSGAYYMYKALQIGLVSRVIPIIGVLIPIYLTIYSAILGDLTIVEIEAILFLVLGAVCLTIFEWRGKLHRHELSYELASSLLFAASYVFLREAYLRESFFTVLVWSRIILVPVGLALIAMPITRIIVLAKDEDGPKFSPFSKIGLLFLFGQVSGGASELLITFSVSLATPALVNSLQGSQYLFIFIASLLLSKKFPHIFYERHTHLKTTFKVIGILFITVGLYLLAFIK